MSNLLSTSIPPAVTDMPKLSTIASIRNGFAFRGRIESVVNGDTRVIQASDLTGRHQGNKGNKETKGPQETQRTELNLEGLATVQLGKNHSVTT